MWEFDGLPLHPLVVHAPVVLVPLVGVGLGLFVGWPAARRVLGPVVVVLAVGAAVTSILAVETGQQLADRLQRGDTVNRHAGRGELVRTMAIVIALIAALVAGLLRSTRDSLRAFAPTAAGVGAVASVVAVVAVGLAGHSGAQLAWEGKIPDGGSGGDATVPDSEPTPVPQATQQPETLPTGESTQTEDALEPSRGEPLVDVVLGEWAIITSVTEAPPGPVTFRIRNAGAETHSFRVRSAGSGRDRLEWRSAEIAPGGELLWTLDLPAGAYEFTCPIEDGFGEHDQLGMEAPFTVRDGAPAPEGFTAPASDTSEPRPDPPDDPGADTVSPEPAETAPAVDVEIRAFAFAQPELRVAPGTDLTWINADPAPHTATGDGFDTGILAQGASATVRFDETGTYPYFCSLHPSMTATIVVGD